MERFRLSIDTEGFDHKPSDKKVQKLEDYLGNPRSEVQIISTRIAQGAGEYTQDELIEAITQGKTWIPHTYAVCPQWKKRRRLSDLWLGAQALGLDFDDGTLHHEDIIKILRDKGLDASIIYETFSHKIEHPKYRVVIFMQHQIIEQIKYYEYLYSFGEIFNGHLDTSCFDIARMFYGSKPLSVVYTSSFRASDTILRPHIGNNVAELVHKRYAKTKRSYIRLSGNMGDIDISNPDRALREQQKALEHLDWETKTNIANKINQELRLLRNFKGQFGSRYQLLWNTSRALGQMGPIALNVAYLWIRDAIESNEYYKQWDKDPHDVIMKGLTWGREHIDDEVAELGHVHVNTLR